MKHINQRNLLNQKTASFRSVAWGQTQRSLFVCESIRVVAVRHGRSESIRKFRQPCSTVLGIRKVGQAHSEWLAPWSLCTSDLSATVQAVHSPTGLLPALSNKPQS